MKLYKILDAKGRSCNGGSLQWSLPENGNPGQWMRPLHGRLRPCQYGYHLCRKEDLLLWLNAVIYEAEYRGAYHCGNIVNSEDKIVVSQVRLVKHLTLWTERTQRLFAADCAEHVLPLFESEYPDDKRPGMAIKTARDYASGVASTRQLRDAKAAWAAAWDAARDAAGAAARAAARAAALAAAGAAARDVAWDAAWDAAGDAAGAAGDAARAAGAAGDAAGAAGDAARAAGDAARAAARAAARDAAWAAAWAAAGAAAWDAAWDASGAAAGAAARAAEKEWQCNNLYKYVFGQNDE